MSGPGRIDPVDEDDDWDEHACELGIDADDYDAYVAGVYERNEENLREYYGTVEEMFPDGVDDDNVFNREED